jgi:hypothetical protein
MHEYPLSLFCNNLNIFRMINITNFADFDCSYIKYVGTNYLVLKYKIETYLYLSAFLPNEVV